MANRRCFQSVARYLHSIKSLAPLSETLSPTPANLLHQIVIQTPSDHRLGNSVRLYPNSSLFTRRFSSKPTDSDNEDEDEDEDDDEGEDVEDYESGEEESERKNENVVLSAEDKEKEAAEIGYTVIGPLQKSDRVFKPYEPVFAVVQVRTSMYLWVLFLVS